MTMNEHINFTRIFKRCPKGTKFYSAIYGEVEFYGIGKDQQYPINLRKGGNNLCITSDGKFFNDNDGECILFPSKEQRDWSKFIAPWYKKEKFDPKALQPYTKVLVRDSNKGQWKCTFYSHERENEKSTFKYVTTDNSLAYVHCIPYNDETKHLVGTTDEAPEYYRYWEG